LLEIITMTELSIVDYFVILEAVGIIATLAVMLYYSRKQMKELSKNIESNILSDLDSKLHNLMEIAISKPEMMEIFDKKQTQSPEQACAVYALNVFAYAFHMRQRGILKEDEWDGWVRTISEVFNKGTISDYWKKSELEIRFNPKFQGFINNEILQENKQKEVK
jgi:hypothetical protein